MSRAPKFGNWCTCIYASTSNPQRHGMFVRVIHRDGKMNRGTFWELTNGRGDFWEVPVTSVVKGTFSPAEIRERDEYTAALAEQTPAAASAPKDRP